MIEIKVKVTLNKINFQAKRIDKKFMRQTESQVKSNFIVIPDSIDITVN